VRILHAIAPGPYGGAESLIRILVRAQQDAGHDASVAALVDPGEEERHPFVVALREQRCAAIGLGVRPRGYLRELRVFAALCERLRPEIVHAHGPRAVVIDGAMARRVGTRLVSTVHGITGGDLRQRIYERLMFAALRRYDAVVAVSGAIAKILDAHGLAPPRLSVIPNAFRATLPALRRSEARRILGLSAETFALGWVGRFVPEKGADVMLAALRHLRSDEWQAVLIGDGPEREAIGGAARGAGLSRLVSMPGAIPDASRLLCAFDVFVLSSRTEGTPMALLEAMAARVPIVATAVGGVPELIRGGEGLLVPANDPRALARAIDQVRLDARAAALRAAAASARLGDRYGVAASTDAYLRLYQRILSQHPGEAAGAHA
jgi:glycosyltransferase involved in cell wall biosynthesis